MNYEKEQSLHYLNEWRAGRIQLTDEEVETFKAYEKKSWWRQLLERFRVDIPMY